MLRNVGIPSRLAVGFIIDRQDLDQDSSAYTVRSHDAYAWVEAYFPGYGWVEFNPSPDRPAELRPGAKSDEITVSPEDLEKLRELPGFDGALFPVSPGDGADTAGSSTSDGFGPPYGLWIALAAAGFAAVVVGAAAVAWRRSVAGLPYAQQVWEKVVRVASWAGHPPRTGQTPSEFARFLDRSVRGVYDIDLVAQAYNRSRFGRGDVSATDSQRLRHVWAGLRGPLFWEIIRRLWRRN